MAAYGGQGQGPAPGPEDPGGRRCRVRRDWIVKGGTVTLRHGARLHHIGGHSHKGKRVVLLVDGLDVRKISDAGDVLRHLTLGPSCDYRPRGS